MVGARVLVTSNMGRDAGLAMYYPVTDNDGAYRVEGLAPGAYLMNVLTTTQGGSMLIEEGQEVTSDINVVQKTPKATAEAGQQGQQPAQ
jgi:hypothetical protein